MGERQRRSQYLPILFLLFLLVGCVPAGCGLDEFICDSYSSVSDKDSAHCFQWIAVQNSDTDECEKVQSESWAGTGQNPPKDKCYLLIAEKNTDPAPCDNIEGGMNSYSKDECYQGVGAKGGDADDCEGLSGDAELECRTGVARGQNSEGNTPSCGTGYVWVTGGLGAGSCVRDPNSEDREKEEATAGGAGTTPVPSATEPEKTTPVKPAETTKDDGKGEQSPEEIVKENFDKADKSVPPTPSEEQGTRLSETLEGIEDEDAKSEIIKAFINERNKRDGMTIKEQQELLEEIKQQYEFGQEMDEKAETIKANTIDPLTEAVDELVEEKMDEAKEGAWEWFKDKTYGWVRGRSPDNERYVKAAELAEERYNQAVEKYNEALESYNKGKDYFDKAKKAYDEVKQVMDNVRRLQDKVSQGRMTQGQADAIKGGVLLGKGLEYTTKYIPVFGDTISEVTAGTFQATMKFAEKRAERTTKLNNCIEDPENCDPNGISAY